MDEEFDFEDLTTQEFEEILVYSEFEDNFKLRYVIACRIIANMIEDIDFLEYSNAELVDLSICKMLIDGHIEIEEQVKKFH